MKRKIQRLNDASFKWSLPKNGGPKGQSFDDRFNDLMAFKAKYGHCDVSRNGENASLGRWCGQLRVSYKKIENNQKPRKKLSNDQIQRLNYAGFKLLSLRDLPKNGPREISAFHMRFKANATYNHYYNPHTGENKSIWSFRN